jgi:Flp pilus assembly secretin CpaC
MTDILHGLALGAVLLFVTISAGLAADRTIVLRPGAGSELVLDRAFDTVLIGDPSIVDVRTRDNRSVFLVPLNPGVTNIIFVNDENIVTANIEVRVQNTDSASSAILALKQLIAR